MVDICYLHIRAVSAGQSGLISLTRERPEHEQYLWFLLSIQHSSYCLQHLTAIIKFQLENIYVHPIHCQKQLNYVVHPTTERGRCKEGTHILEVGSQSFRSITKSIHQNFQAYSLWKTISAENCQQPQPTIDTYVPSTIIILANYSEQCQILPQIGEV